jgi:carbon monoxide dehydrogenase subunit G
VISFQPQGSWSLIKETARTQAIAGAAAGAALGILRGIVSVRSNRMRDGYDVMTEGLAEIGTGAVLGAMSAVAATATGVTVAAVTGRTVLTVAAPLVASALTSSLAHKRVDRQIRPMSEDFVHGLRQALEDSFPRGTVPRSERP